jgi:hypothetical protein
MEEALSAQRYLSLREKARQLSVCEETVRRHAKELGGIKIGKLWRFPYDCPRLVLPDSEKHKQGDQQCQTSEELQESRSRGELCIGRVSTEYAQALGLLTGQKRLRMLTS